MHQCALLDDWIHTKLKMHFHLSSSASSAHIKGIDDACIYTCVMDYDLWFLKSKQKKKKKFLHPVKIPLVLTRMSSKTVNISFFCKTPSPPKIYIYIFNIGRVDANVRGFHSTYFHNDRCRCLSSWVYWGTESTSCSWPGIQCHQPLDYNNIIINR